MNTEEIMPKKILIVQHDELSLTMMELRLEMEGLRTITCRSAEEGIRLFKQLSPDLVLVSTKTPRMVPAEVVAQMKAINPDLKILPADLSSSMQKAGLDNSEDLDVIFDQLSQLELLINNVKTALGLEVYLPQN
jgi:response regulator RpfG family c-di-GMP phosphodiesterase